MARPKRKASNSWDAWASVAHSANKNYWTEHSLLGQESKKRKKKGLLGL